MAATKLLAPLRAMGCRSTTFIKTPPRLHKIAAITKSRWAVDDFIR